MNRRSWQNTLFGPSPHGGMDISYVGPSKRPGCFCSFRPGLFLSTQPIFFFFCIAFWVPQFGMTHMQISRAFVNRQIEQK